MWLFLINPKTFSSWKANVQKFTANIHLELNTTSKRKEKNTDREVSDLRIELHTSLSCLPIDHQLLMMALSFFWKEMNRDSEIQFKHFFFYTVSALYQIINWNLCTWLTTLNMKWDQHFWPAYTCWWPPPVIGSAQNIHVSNNPILKCLYRNIPASWK